MLNQLLADEHRSSLLDKLWKASERYRLLEVLDKYTWQGEPKEKWRPALGRWSNDDNGILVHYIGWDKCFDKEIKRAEFDTRVRDYFTWIMEIEEQKDEEREELIAKYNRELVFRLLILEHKNMKWV